MFVSLSVFAELLCNYQNDQINDDWKKYSLDGNYSYKYLRLLKVIVNGFHLKFDTRDKIIFRSIATLLILISRLQI